MENSHYWEDRLANVVWNSYNSLEEQNMALLDHYNKTMNNIRAELIKLEEQKSLTRSEKYRVQHLKSIQEQIIKECEKLGDSVENDMINNVSKQMQSIYKTSFSNISDEKFHQLSKNACKDIINTPWQGSSFSKRLWDNTGKLANELNNILSVGITQGKTISEMAFQLSNRMNKDMNACHRLVRTETINSLNRASLRGMIDAGVRYVRWWAAQDERECDECGANHNKIYSIDKAPNLPCHPGCRCTWLPVFEDELDKYYRMVDHNENTLYNYTKSDKIESVKNSAELKELFTYTDKYGHIRNPFNKSFDNFKLSTQKEIAEGIMYMKGEFGLDALSFQISQEQLKNKLGVFRITADGLMNIALSSSLNNDLKMAFPTIVHEMSHYIDTIHSEISKSVVDEALKNLKIRRNTSNELKKRVELMGFFDEKYLKDDSELFSFSIEREATRKGTDLSKQIVEILKRRLSK